MTIRIENISKELQFKLKTDFEIGKCFSLQFDESTYITDKRQLLFRWKYDFTVKELLKMLLIKERIYYQYTKNL